MNYFIHADHIDTPRVVVDRGNNLRWRWIAEPFGTTAPETNPASLGNFTLNLRFPGQYADSESGLSYNFFRGYDSSTGRYVQSDPIGLDGGINTYAYTANNPLLYVDPNGLTALGTAFGVVGTWGGRAGGAIVGEAAFPLGGGIVGGLVGGKLGNAAGTAFGDWLDTLIFNEPITNPQQLQDYNEYKTHEDNRPPKGPKCEDMKRQLRYWKRVLELRTSYANKWFGGTFDPGHLNRVNIAHQQIERYEKAVKEMCKDECS